MDDDNSTVPPTTHDIPHPDRLRMVRSMRKLTAVLGETPVVETASPPPHLLTPKRSFFFHASASLSSLTLPFQKSDAPAAAEPRPSLVVCVPPVPHKFTPLPSPLSPTFTPTFSPPPSPVSPEQEPDRRRLRLAKVSRTLGETVPPELIFTEPVVKRRRRASTLVLPESALEHQTFALAGGLADGELRSTRRPTLNVGANKVIKRAMSFILPTDSADNAANASDPMSPLGEVHVHPAMASFSPDTVSPPEAVGWLRRASRAILNVEQDRQPVTFADDATSPTGLPPTYEESHQHGPTRAETSPASSSQAEGMRRQEVEWTGEWRGNVDNMDDVVRNLRGLKLK
ncbi:hypothetical protein R3P38DRAFT_2978543 [Favolaschia claudopus]|uniref:Uncharacterized protein n=1 Tax=Favolaschia claudopus TaxID=2862362 RepID=A0AAW0B3I9_9AGAR